MESRGLFHGDPQGLDRQQADRLREILGVEDGAGPRLAMMRPCPGGGRSWGRPEPVANSRPGQAGGNIAEEVTVTAAQVAAAGDVQEQAVIAIGGDPRRPALALCGETLEFGGIPSRIGVTDCQVGNQRPSLGNRDAGHEALGRRLLADGGEPDAALPRCGQGNRTCRVTRASPEPPVGWPRRQPDRDETPHPPTPATILRGNPHDIAAA